MKHVNQIEYQVYGKYALFSDPVTRVGGEKYSYPVPTYQALKGITESIYWKPTFLWVIDSVRIMMPIRTESKNMRPIQYNGGNTLSIYNYLRDVNYHVKAHFEWNENRPELANDRNENKHYFIAKRMIEKGGRRDIFLGTRECQGYVEPCSFDDGDGYYNDWAEMNFGVMLHGISYADESSDGCMRVRLWRPEMRYGVIDFVRPDDCEIIRKVRNQTASSFCEGTNFSSCDGLFRREGGIDELDAETM